MVGGYAYLPKDISDAIVTGVLTSLSTGDPHRVTVDNAFNKIVSYMNSGKTILLEVSPANTTHIIPLSSYKGDGVFAVSGWAQFNAPTFVYVLFSQTEPDKVYVEATGLM